MQLLFCPTASHTRPAAHNCTNTSRSHGQDLLGDAPTDQDRKQKLAQKMQGLASPILVRPSLVFERRGTPD